MPRSVARVSASAVRNRSKVHHELSQCHQNPFAFTKVRGPYYDDLRVTSIYLWQMYPGFIYRLFTTSNGSQVDQHRTLEAAFKYPTSATLALAMRSPSWEYGRSAEGYGGHFDWRKLAETLKDLTLRATTYALSHSLLYLPPAQQQPLTPAAAIHAPISLFPSPLPRRLFELARRLQSTYNILYARIALDVEFLDRVMGTVEGVGKVDNFVGQLWTGWKKLRDEGSGLIQPLQLGLFRSDYLMHSSETELSLKQVEFNTISSSFGPLSQQTAALHRHLFASTGYFNSYSSMKAEDFPTNETIAGLVSGLAAAHFAYGVKDAKILFVVQPGERNVFDQRLLEYELLEKHSIQVVRQTFDQLALNASLDPATSRLLLSTGTEISTVYFRAGYTPTDYPTSAQYETRFILEKSRAIKCPSIALQLAGGKKVQQVLAEPGVLERFMDDADARNLLRTSWMGMWALESDIERTRIESHKLVLKPQREGGGNNVYKEAIPPFLDSLPEPERAAWIAMELIEPPEGTGGYLVRSGVDQAMRTEVVSELGIFGWALYGGRDGKIEEKEAGWLVRTKGKESNEGGVATGFSVLDSIFLVNEDVI
ncbi:Glutathione synthetase [Mycena indigotica]|uniref:glutathione synthase n=1 Tax=Mycena indigotica TaxID=2126181 RepID=A0A8H6S3S7_9AGAR|nr:Glutathione synthetase [Mycena indigotica]KAF7291892.1 Glutathione synthetase [Mycena indigotica]